MTSNKIKISFFFLFLFLDLNVYGQEKSCIGSEPIDRVLFNQWLTSVSQSQSLFRTSANPFNVPVIVHVIHDGQSIGTGSNISLDQILSQFEVLNDDFNRLNSDTVNTPLEFESITGAMNIHFVPALVDNNGEMLIEPGVNRINRNVAGFDPEPYSYDYLNTTILPLTIWDPDRYFNIWVCDFSTALGAAQFPDINLPGIPPSNSADTDGIIVGYKFFGTIGEVEIPLAGGRTATHEIGHWLGLHHIWGPHDAVISDCTDDDFISDTPNQDKANQFCPSSQGPVCTGTTREMWENYMDFTWDDCMNLFTQGQVDRMITVIENAPRRLALLTSLAGDKFEQEIAFEALISPVYGEEPYIVLDAIAISGLDVVYNSSDPSIVSIGNDTAYIHSAGVITITASQAGDLFYLPAPEIFLEFTVQKVSTILSIGEIGEKIFGDDPFPIEVTPESQAPITYVSSLPEVLSIIGNIATIVDVGEVQITISQEASTNYLGVDTVLLLVIGKGFQEIIRTSTDSLKDVDDFVMLFESSIELPLSYEITSEAAQIGTGNELTIIQPGLVTLSVSQPGNDQYNPAVPVIDTAFCIWPIPVITQSATNNKYSITLSSNYPAISRWYFNNEIKSDQTSILVAKFGEYRLEVDPGDGCNLSVTLDVGEDLITSINDRNPEGERIRVFPNPAESILTVEFERMPQRTEATIYNIQGQRILNKRIKNSNTQLEIDHLKQGVYILLITFEGREQHHRFVKK